MEHNLGNIIAERKTKTSTTVILRLSAIIVFLLFVLLGIAMLYEPMDPDDIELIIASGVFLAIGIIVPIILFTISVKGRSYATIFEEGITVRRGKNEQTVHFNDILGIRDIPKEDSFFIFNFGLIGAIIAGAALGASRAIRDAANARHRILKVRIVLKDSSEVKVVDTAGDELSDIYTKWLIKQLNIIAENVSTQVITFGDSFKLESGTFINTRRRGEDLLPLEEVTEVNLSGNDFSFFALNEKGKERKRFSIKVSETLNIELLVNICVMAGIKVS